MLIIDKLAPADLVMVDGHKIGLLTNLPACHTSDRRPYASIPTTVLCGDRQREADVHRMRPFAKYSHKIAVQYCRYIWRLLDL